MENYFDSMRRVAHDIKNHLQVILFSLGNFGVYSGHDVVNLEDSIMETNVMVETWQGLLRAEDDSSTQSLLSSIKQGLMNLGTSIYLIDPVGDSKCLEELLTAKENYDDAYRLISRAEKGYGVKPVFERIDLHQASERALRSAKRLTKSDIHVKTMFEPGKFYAHFDDIVLKEVLLNLSKNAVEVMEDGDELLVWLGVDGEKEKIYLAVQDSGSGISEEGKQKLFRKHYSTKGPGRGVGLYTSYKLIREMGGDLEAESDLGVGTIMLLTLPRYQK